MSEEIKKTEDMKLKNEETSKKPPNYDKRYIRRYKMYARLKNKYLNKVSLQPIKDYLQSSVAVVRYAQHSDVDDIQKLITDHSLQMFGDYSIQNLIEMVNCSLVQTTANGTVVGFLALANYPNIPAIPTFKWTPWLDYLYRMELCSARNTMFIHAALWEKSFEAIFMLNFLDFVYLNILQLEYVHLIVPPKVEPCTNNNKDQDNLDIMPQLNSMAPILQEIYGEYLISEIIRFSSDTRVGLTGLVDNNCVGFMLLSKSLCYETIEQYFEVEMVNGFRKPHAGDFLPRLTNEAVIDKVPINVPASVTVDISEVTQKEVGEQLSLASEDQESEKKQMSSESLLSEDFEIFELDAQTFALPPIVSPGLCFQTQSIVNQINLCPGGNVVEGDLLVHGSGKNDLKVLPFGVPPPITFNPPPVPAEFKGVSNAVIIEIYMMGDGTDIRLGYDFLEAIFEAAETYEYCLISLPTDMPLPPLLTHFNRVMPKVGTLFPHELFFVHRSAVLSDLQVRDAFPGDVLYIMELTSGMDKYKVIRDDFLESITSPKSHLSSFVLLSENVVCGVCIISKVGYDMKLLESQFDISRHMVPSLHPNYGFIVHTLVTPEFWRLMPLFFREVQRCSSVSCLFYPLYTEDVFKSRSVRTTMISCIQELQPIQPIHHLQYRPVGEIKNTTIVTAGGHQIKVQTEDYLAPIRALQEFVQTTPFALFYTNLKLAAMNRSNIFTKIVVVGASETALAFLESLIFRSSPTVIYKNITLVSPHGLPYQQKPHPARDAMLIYNGRYDYRFMVQLGLNAWVNVVYGYMTEIDRNGKTIVIDYEKKVSYDYLFLFCGLQVTKPLPQPLQSEKYHPVSGPKQVQRYLEEFPVNMFLIRSVVDASNSLASLHRLMKENASPEARIIVYGHTLQAFAVIHALIEFGVEPKEIAFVESFPNNPAVTLFNNAEVDHAVLETLQELGVVVFQNCRFSRWEVSKSDNIIRKITFESITRTHILECICIFTFDFKSIDFRTFLAVINSGLVYDGRIVIDKNFRTSDTYIYAAGPVTKYRRRYFADHLNHENFNSFEIGSMMYDKVEQRLDPSLSSYLEEDTDDEDDDDEEETEDEENDDEEEEDDEESSSSSCSSSSTSSSSSSDEKSDKYKITDLPEFTKPLIEYCVLPGGWNYLHIRKPGLIMPIECQLNTTIESQTTTVYITGNCRDADGPGYFRLAFNNVDKICEITCYTRQDIEINNLIRLYGRNISVLNNLHQRYTLGTVPDLYEYFRQTWCTALYFPNTEAFANQLDKFFYEKNEDESGVPFIESITDTLELNRYGTVPDEDKEELRDRFYQTGIAEKIQHSIKKFLLELRFHMPMYISDEYIIVTTEKVKGRHLHSKPLLGITRQTLLEMKDKQKAEDEELIMIPEAEYGVEAETIPEEDLKEEDSTSFEEKEGTKSSLDLQPQISEMQEPPRDAGIMTESPGFCVLSSLRLHKGPNVCKYCNKVILKGFKKHMEEHKQAKIAEIKETDYEYLAPVIHVPRKFSGQLFYEDEESSETADDYKSIDDDKSIGAVYDLSENFKVEDIAQLEISKLVCRAQAAVRQKLMQAELLAEKIRQENIKEEGGEETDTVLEDSEYLEQMPSLLDLKEPQYSKLEILPKSPEELKEEAHLELLKQKRKRRVFDRLKKSWINYYK